MTASAFDVYVAGFAERCAVMGGTRLDEPGIHGLVGASARLLVWDDGAYDRLADLLPGFAGGLIRVLITAPRCAGRLAADAAWEVDPMQTAMLLRDLATVPALSLPEALTIRPVRRRDDEDGVPLDAVVAVAVRSDDTIHDPPETFVEYLRNVHPAFQLYAAVDAAGVVCATSAVGTFGAQADVFFVNTVPEWRGRGLARAMTAAALITARERGARRACLDATDAGTRIYRRLGFETVSRTTHFYREIASAQSPS